VPASFAPPIQTFDAASPIIHHSCYASINTAFYLISVCFPAGVGRTIENMLRSEEQDT